MKKNDSFYVFGAHFPWIYLWLCYLKHKENEENFYQPSQVVCNGSVDSDIATPPEHLLWRHFDRSIVLSTFLV